MQAFAQTTDITAPIKPSWNWPAAAVVMILVIGILVGIISYYSSSRRRSEGVSGSRGMRGEKGPPGTDKGAAPVPSAPEPPPPRD